MRKNFNHKFLQSKDNKGNTVNVFVFYLASTEKKGVNGKKIDLNSIFNIDNNNDQNNIYLLAFR